VIVLWYWYVAASYWGGAVVLKADSELRRVNEAEPLTKKWKTTTYKEESIDDTFNDDFGAEEDSYSTDTV
jgi:hypothetical protein